MGSHDLFESLLDYTRSYVRLRHYAAATRRGYLTDQLLFVRFLKAQYGVSRVDEVERRHIVDYLTHAERRGLRGTTIARKLAALRSFFAYLVEDGRITSSPVRGIPPPKQEWAQPRVLSQIEYGRLKAAAERDPRARAIVEIFLQTGIRLSEAAQLRVEDVVLPEAQELPSIGLLRVWGKGRRERSVTLNSKACQALSAYLTTRTEYDKHAHLFVSKYGASLTPRSIQPHCRKAHRRCRGRQGQRAYAQAYLRDAYGAKGNEPARSSGGVGAFILAYHVALRLPGSRADGRTTRGQRPIACKVDCATSRAACAG